MWVNTPYIDCISLQEFIANIQLCSIRFADEVTFAAVQPLERNFDRRAANAMQLLMAILKKLSTGLFMMGVCQPFFFEQLGAELLRM